MPALAALLLLAVQAPVAPDVDPEIGPEIDPGVADVPRFEYANGFWINLHHFLYSEALAAKRGDGLADGSEAWAEAVRYYREHLLSRDLLFDAGMRATDLALGEAGARADLADVELEGELAFVLESVAPLYRAGDWPAHERANAAWARAMEPVVDEHLAPVARRLASAFGAEWPAEPVRVDLLAYANWAGAYTSDEPSHIRIGTLLPEPCELPEAFEVLVHEAGHLVIRPVRLRILELCKERGVQPPRALWHAILFFTAGHLVLDSPVTPDDYEPYAYAHGLAGGSMARDYRALEAHWPAYLAGEIELDAALAAVLDELARPR